MEDQGSVPLETEWVVPAELGGIRLDAFMRQRFPRLSRRSIEAVIDAGAMSINRRKGKKGDRLTAGDLLRFIGPVSWLLSSPVPEPCLRVSIVFEDDYLLIVDKPAGMDTHGFSGRERHTLTNFLAARRPELAAVGKSCWEPGLVHRLDRETSGLIVIAKNQSVYEYLRAQFRQRAVKKQYWALVWGETRSSGSITFPIAHDSRDRKKMRAVLELSKNRRGQRIWHASTRFRRLASRRGVSFLEIDMETGVTHQIRVHLAALGHPIVGDLLYGKEGAETFGLQRHFLHAFCLEFLHPKDGRLLRTESRLPEELADVLKSLRIQH